MPSKLLPCKGEVAVRPEGYKIGGRRYNPTYYTEVLNR